MSRWSSPAKAAEFAAVYAKSLAQRYKRPRGLGTDGKLSEMRRQSTPGERCGATTCG